MMVEHHLGNAKTERFGPWGRRGEASLVAVTQTREIRMMDTPLLRFETTVSDLGERSGSVTWINDDAVPVMPAPLIVDRSWAAVWSWLSERRIPRNRAFVEQVLKQAGLDAADTLGIIDACKGLSLNDSFWVVPVDFKGRWSDYDLYSHRLDDVLSLVAYTGYTSSQRHEAGLSSEWTTQGSYPKAWRTVEGHPVLYKAGNWPLYEGAANEDLGPWSEWLSAQVAEAMGIPHVAYGLERWKGHVASTCRCFCDEGTSYVTMWDACRVAGLLPIAAALLARSEDDLSVFLDLVAMDAVIANPDRHATNLGFLRNARTGAFQGMAPAFDQNMALFPHDLPEDFASWPERARSMHSSGTNLSFADVMARFQTPRQHRMLCRLVDFSFEQHSDYPLPEDRMLSLNRLVRENARVYLEMSPRPLGEVAAMVRTSEAWRTQDAGAMPLLVRDAL